MIIIKGYEGTMTLISEQPDLPETFLGSTWITIGVQDVIKTSTAIYKCITKIIDRH